MSNLKINARASTEQISYLDARTCRRRKQDLQVASSAVRHVDAENNVLQKIDLVLVTFAPGRLQRHDNFTTARHRSTAAHRQNSIATVVGLI